MAGAPAAFAPDGAGLFASARLSLARFGWTKGLAFGFGGRRRADGALPFGVLLPLAAVGVEPGGPAGVALMVGNEGRDVGG